MSLKIKAMLFDTEITATVEIAQENLNDHLGKVLYGFEMMGVTMNTAEVYDECVKTLEDTKLTGKKYVTLVERDNLTVKIK